MSNIESGGPPVEGRESQENVESNSPETLELGEWSETSQAIDAMEGSYNPRDYFDVAGSVDEIEASNPEITAATAWQESQRISAQLTSKEGGDRIGSAKLNERKTELGNEILSAALHAAAPELFKRAQELTADIPANEMSDADSNQRLASLLNGLLNRKSRTDGFQLRAAIERMDEESLAQLSEEIGDFVKDFAEEQESDRQLQMAALKLNWQGAPVNTVHGRDRFNSQIRVITDVLEPLNARMKHKAEMDQARNAAESAAA